MNTHRQNTGLRAKIERTEGIRLSLADRINRMQYSEAGKRMLEAADLSAATERMFRRALPQYAADSTMSNPRRRNRG